VSAEDVRLWMKRFVGTGPRHIVVTRVAKPSRRDEGLGETEAGSPSDIYLSRKDTIS
jgi:hypothetical protein